MAFAIRRPDSAFSLDPSDRKQKRIIDDRHLAFIRTLPSIVSGKLGCEACHIRYGDPVYRKKHTGKSQKPDDAWTVPMTPEEHRAQHAGNEQEWWASKGINPVAVAWQLYSVSGDRERAVAILSALQAKEGMKP